MVRRTNLATVFAFLERILAVKNVDWILLDDVKMSMPLCGSVSLLLEC